MNVENLFHRFQFEGHSGMKRYVSLMEPSGTLSPKALAETYFNALNEEKRTFTALTLEAAGGEPETAPDITCLQEVDSLEVLKYFCEHYLSEVGSRPDYTYKRLINGNDPRGIDVAALSTHKITHIESHQEYRGENGNLVFDRDCLEVTVEDHGIPLTLFINHFKSMAGGRSETQHQRVAQSKAVRDIIENTFEDPSSEDWMIVGDLNDYYLDENGHPLPDEETGLAPLEIGDFCIDLLDNLPDGEPRWTHYWSGGDEYRQLDYLLLSPNLYEKNRDTTPEIVRKGMPYRARKYDGDRWARIGHARPKASDHCAVAATITL